MPAELSGLQNFGGLGTGGNFAPVQSNALPNTPFLTTASNAGVGTGALGEFGGYVPTPLPQFNNYTDYLSFMPGAPQMDRYAEMMLKPNYYNYDTAVAR